YKKVGIGVGLVIVVAVIILLLLRSCGAPANDPGGIEFDPSATEGGWDEADMDAIRDSLNEKVEEGMINISMNTSPVFSDGESAGSLMIVNDDINRYPLSVEITRNDSGEVIYTSKAVPVGSRSSRTSSTTLTPVHTSAPLCSSTSTPTPATSSARRASSSTHRP
ncbi:MAG: hypothetical protein ACLUFK_11585, partial [Oscillospiraceae bacterium]